MYDDKEGEYITPSAILRMMSADVRHCDAIIWTGISFEQSASCGYYRRVLESLQSVGREKTVPQFIVDPGADDAEFHVQSAQGPMGVGRLYKMRSTSDDVFNRL